jgi:hypothetical protein
MIQKSKCAVGIITPCATTTNETGFSKHTIKTKPYT